MSLSAVEGTPKLFDYFSPVCAQIIRRHMDDVFRHAFNASNLEEGLDILLTFVEETDPLLYIYLKCLEPSHVCTARAGQIVAYLFETLGLTSALAESDTGLGGYMKVLLDLPEGPSDGARAVALTYLQQEAGQDFNREGDKYPLQ